MVKNEPIAIIFVKKVNIFHIFQNGSYKMSKKSYGETEGKVVA